MDERVNLRRRAVAGLITMLIGAGCLIGASQGGAGATAGQASTTPTVEVDENATCAELAPEGTTWIELKVEPVGDGTFSDGTLTVTIDVRNTADGPVFDWTSNIGVDAVFVKGGPNGLLYVYDPPAESTGDTGLHAPVNPNNGKFFGLSHVSFCYDKDQATTSTTDGIDHHLDDHGADHHLDDHGADHHLDDHGADHHLDDHGADYLDDRGIDHHLDDHGADYLDDRGAEHYHDREADHDLDDRGAEHHHDREADHDLDDREADHDLDDRGAEQHHDGEADQHHRRSGDDGAGTVDHDKVRRGRTRWTAATDG